MCPFLLFSHWKDLQMPFLSKVFFPLFEKKLSFVTTDLFPKQCFQIAKKKPHEVVLLWLHSLYLYFMLHDYKGYIISALSLNSSAPTAQNLHADFSFG